MLASGTHIDGLADKTLKYINKYFLKKLIFYLFSVLILLDDAYFSRSSKHKVE